MKKLLLTLGLAALTLASAHADGSISPLNTPLTRFVIDSNQNGTTDPGDRPISAADGITLHVFYGAAGSTREQLTHFPQFAIIGDGGLATGLPSTLVIPGFEVGDIISLQMRLCSADGLFGETDVKQITLGPASGPGTVVWGSTASPSRFGPIVALVGGGQVCVPEPSTLALGGLACGFLLLRLRKSKRQ